MTESAEKLLLQPLPPRAPAGLVRILAVVAGREQIPAYDLECGTAHVIYVTR